MDLDRYPGEPDFLVRLPGFFKTLGGTAWGLEWSRFYPWTVGPRFGSLYTYPEECVQGLCRRSRDEGIDFLPVIDFQVLSDLVLECGCFDHMHTSASDSLTPRLDPAAIGGRQLLDELLEDVFSLYGDSRPLVVRNSPRGIGAETTEKIAGYIEERFDIRVHLVRSDVDTFVFIEEPGGPWVGALHRAAGAEEARDSAVYRTSRETDDLLGRIEKYTEAAWKRVRLTREVLIRLQERTSPIADLREGESLLTELKDILTTLADISRELEEKTRGVLEITHLRGLGKSLVYPIEEELAGLQARLKHFAPPISRKKS